MLLPNNTPAAFREIINRKRTIKIHEHMQTCVHTTSHQYLCTFVG